MYELFIISFLKDLVYGIVSLAFLIYKDQTGTLEKKQATAQKKF